MINILLAEDHVIVRDGMNAILSTETDFTVVGEASNGEEALALLQNGLKPDVVLTDINMPELDGLELAEKLREEFPQVKVAILTMVEDESTLQLAFDHGAAGYIIKTVCRQELAFAIRHIAKGNHYISADLACKLIRQASSPQPTALKIDLSLRESEILKLVAAGMTNNQIADKLFTSRRTVEGHRQKLLNKTRTKNTASLIHFAIQHKLLESG